jgi:hypothetical protein
LSFVPFRDERYEFEFPNKLGDLAITVEEAIDKLADLGNGVAYRDPAKYELISRYISSLEGELATKKIIDIVDECVDGRSNHPSPIKRISGIVCAEGRALNKTAQRLFGVARYDPRFIRQRFPAISTEVLQEKADRLTRLLGGEQPVNVLQRDTDLFETCTA